MAGNANGKLRILCLMQMLEEETDAETGLSMTKIISKLDEEWGLSADRKTIYNDFDTLREFGLKIEKLQKSPVEYAITNRDFSLDELMLMVDAVQSCQFITQRQVDRICCNLKLLATDNQREKLERRIHVEGRARGRNDKVLANVDAIHEALRSKHKITFTYWKIGADGEAHAQHDGELYVVTPMRVTFSENHYYLTAWSDKYDAAREYRIDRMRDLAVSPEKAIRGSKISDYEYQVVNSQYFGRFDGPKTSVTFRVSDDLMSTVWDRFGKDARVVPLDDKTAEVTTTVRVSPQFFGWVAGLSGGVTIEKPASLLDEYHAYLRQLLEA